MAPSRIDAVQAGYAAFDRGEFDVVTSGYHDDAVFDFSEVDMFHGLLTGKKTFPSAWTGLRDAWEDWGHRVESIEEVSADQVLSKLCRLDEARKAESR